MYDKLKCKIDCHCRMNHFFCLHKALALWYLHQYDFIVEDLAIYYEEEIKTNPADYLSRHPVVFADVCTVTKKCKEEDMLYIDAVIRANLPKAVTKEHMLKATLEDETLTVLKELISQGYINKEQKRKLASYAHKLAS